MIRALLALAALLLAAAPMFAYEQAFPPTPNGVTEVKTLPSGLLLKSSARGSYFEQSGNLFRPLFSYISARDIKMTVPVETRMENAEMFFWVGKKEAEKVKGDAPGVEVVRIPERLVASAGGRGSYSEENFARTRDALLAWVNRQPGLTAAGKAYAVYWNGPFTPWFLRRYEVHLPVKRK